MLDHILTPETLAGWQAEIDKRRDAVTSHIATAAFHQIISRYHIIGRSDQTDTEIRDDVESLIAAEARRRMPNA